MKQIFFIIFCSSVSLIAAGLSPADDPANNMGRNVVEAGSAVLGSIDDCPYCNKDASPVAIRDATAKKKVEGDQSELSTDSKVKDGTH
jgi:hypothetical protein